MENDTDYNTFDHYVHDWDVTQHFSDGEHVSTAFKNVFGGSDYYDDHGNLTLHTVANIDGGHDYLDANGHLLSHAAPNHEGGQDIYSDGNLAARLVPNVHGGHDVYGSDGALQLSTIPVGHDFVEVMHHSDPLLHAAQYQIPELDLNF